MNDPVYLAGPMTGMPEWNTPAFNEAARVLRAVGHVVVNPAELDEADPAPRGERPWADYIRRDLCALSRCQSVAVLPGWRESRGARLEVHVAQALGMDVVDAATLRPVTETVLEEAQRVVDGDRAKHYGHPFDNHGCTARLMEAYMERRYGAARIDAHDVCVFNLLQKVSRMANTPGHRDSLVDLAGYARNIEMLGPDG